MKVKHQSSFKNATQDHAWFRAWVKRLESANDRKYESIEVTTALGKTQVWALNADKKYLEALVIFPGARTTALFWDLDRGLDQFEEHYRIFMVETNGLPNLSDGGTPEITSTDYGQWASEIFNGLGITKAFIAGASFGGLICMKLAITNPEKIKAVFLFNPGCLQSFSLKIKNLYYNLLPIFSPSEKNVRTFLDKAVLCKPSHQLSKKAEQLLVDYEVYALTRFKDNTQKPYYMDEELSLVTVDTYLLLGDHDLLFPYNKSVLNAHEKISSLRDVKVFEDVGHGIETAHQALRYAGSIMKKIQSERITVPAL